MATLSVAGMASTGLSPLTATLPSADRFNPISSHPTLVLKSSFLSNSALSLARIPSKNIKTRTFVAIPSASADVSTIPRSPVDDKSKPSAARDIHAGSMKRLKAVYEEEIVPTLMKEFGYSNRYQVPKVKKISINCGVGDASQNAKALDGAKKDISIATGQQPVVTRAKKAISGFKIRQNMAVGLLTTLRGELMYSFQDRLVNLVLPRMRDFGGLNRGSFDGRGNYSFGLTEQTLFPEISYETIDKTRGMDITIVTTANTDREAQRLLELIGIKFREEGSEAMEPRKVKKKKNTFHKR